MYKWKRDGIRNRPQELSEITSLITQLFFVLQEVIFYSGLFINYDISRCFTPMGVKHVGWWFRNRFFFFLSRILMGSKIHFSSCDKSCRSPRHKTWKFIRPLLFRNFRHVSESSITQRAKCPSFVTGPFCLVLNKNPLSHLNCFYYDDVYDIVCGRSKEIFIRHRGRTVHSRFSAENSI